VMNLELPKPSKLNGPIDLLIIAGEHSGDEHAGGLVEKLLREKPDLNIAAIGGEKLRLANAQLLFDLTAHSVVGFIEVLKNYRFFKNVLESTIDWIEKYRPKVICFVDYPGFNLRLAKRLKEKGLSKKGGGEITLAYYISPQIWAWKAKRRFSMAKTLDALGVIFPFEVDCYRDTELPAQFVGHPFLEENFKNPIEYNAKGAILLLPGSRKAAIGHIFPIMLKAFEKFLEKRPNEKGLVIVPNASLKAFIRDMVMTKPDLIKKISIQEKDDIGRIEAKAVLMSSGTMSFLCFLGGIPGAIVYRAHRITYILGRLVAKVKYLSMANILLNGDVYPEFIQGEAKTAPLVKELMECCESSKRREQVVGDVERLRVGLNQAESYPVDSWLMSLLEKTASQSRQTGALSH